MAEIPRHRLLLAVAAFTIGLMTAIEGLLLSAQPRSNVEESLAGWVLMGGMFLMGVGISLPFARPIVVVATGIVFPVVGWLLLISAYYAALGHSRWPSQEKMVRSGYQIISEAQQIDELFSPAWHQLSNYDEPDIAEWQTDAFFGGRYELEMCVSVRIDRHTGRVIEVVGEPRFGLMEVEKIVDSREVSYNGNNQHQFGIREWQRVVAAQGDFSAIGIHLDRDHPVPGFDRYLAAPRNGIQMRPNGKAHH